MLSADTISSLQAFFNSVDADGDGFVTIAEIREACAVDINNDGVITDAEKDCTARQWLYDFPLQDTDGDARLSFAELLDYNERDPATTGAAAECAH